MIYLIELEALAPGSDVVETLRYGTAAYFTEPTDDPANADFEPRVVDPGNFERHLFAQGRTIGVSEVGGGLIELANPDGALDFLLDYALDGRALRIYGVADPAAAWSSRVTVLAGTMEQATFGAHKVAIRIRDRLALLREPILTDVYLGTTVSGGRADAEGGKDLKDVKKPRLFGRRRNVQPVEVDGFDLIYQISSGPVAAVSRVLDRMIPLTFTSNVATLAALKALSLSGGQYATCLALGLVRTGVRPDGVLTVEASEGASVADRSAARIVERMLAGVGQVAAADFDTLHAQAPDECGIWIPPGDTDILSAAQMVLSSVGASLTVDRFGVFRAWRLDLPAGPPAIVLDETQIVAGSDGMGRSAPGDQGEGLPAWRVTIRFDFNDTVMTFPEISTAASEADRSFAEKQWRQVVVEDAATKARHPLAPELDFETALLTEADAEAFAGVMMARYGVRRDLFRLEVSSDEVASLDLHEVVQITVPRFGMDAGRLFRVIGLTPTLSRNVTTIEAWG